MNPKIKKRIYYSLLFSLLIHLGFLIWSFFIKLVPYTPSFENPQKFIHVKIAREQRIGQDAPTSEKNNFQKSMQPDNPFSDVSTFESKTESRQTSEESIASAVINKTQPPTPLLPHEEENFKVTQMNDDVITQQVKRSTRKNLVEVGDIPHKDFSSGAPVVVSGNEVSKDFLDKGHLAVKTSPSAPLKAKSNIDEYQVMKKSSSGIDKKSKTTDLGSALAYELSTYQDPTTGQKYFKLLVRVRDATINFPIIPKEIIFLVDSSNSIGELRLEQFITGVNYSLNNLNPNDRFNIILFKDKTIPLSPESLAANPINIQRASNFLKLYKAGSTTDVYNAFKTSIPIDDSFSPSYRVLLSDGFATSGMTNSRQVINEISKVNKNRVSIFAFGGGVHMSRYLLDFIAHKNRGWSQFEGRENLMATELSNMYDKIKDPLLLHLRYRISGVKDNEVFPKIMPDFFKGSEFVIYGTFTDENNIFIQVLGDVSGQVKEFAIKASLKEASAGDKQIATQWAFHKIYHLIGELKYNEDNQPLIAQIDALCDQYGIITPYSRNFRDNPIKKEPKIKSTDSTNSKPAKNTK